MTNHAFIDESVRGANYCLCATLITEHGLAKARSHMRSLLVPGQRRLHFVSESPQHRRTLLRDIAKIPCQSTVHVGVGGAQLDARATALKSLVVELVDGNVDRIVLDSRQGQDHRDRSVIAKTLGNYGELRIQYLHLSSVDEPLLWIPDAVAWAWGRGRVWRSLLSDLDLIHDAECATVVPVRSARQNQRR